jgi:hypothetical protein
MMNGSLSVISKIKEGSTFIVEIPNIPISNLSDKTDSSDILNFQEHIINKDINAYKNNIEIKNIQALNQEMIEKMFKLKDNLWLNCISKNRVSDIKRFAALILEIGYEFNHNNTIEYAKLLQAHINSFDLKNTKELLNQFPTMLEIYKSNINK